MAKKRRAKSKSRSQKPQYILLIIYAFLIGYYPLLMRTIVFRTGLTDFEWFAASLEQQVDVFLFVKSIALCVVGALLVGILFYWMITNEKMFTTMQKAFIFLGVAALMTIIAAFATPYHFLVAHGVFENFESVFVILTYFLICFVLCLYLSQTDDIARDFIFTARLAAPGYLILLLIGYFQVQGMDLFQTTFGKKLFTSSQFWDELDSISISGGEYITLHNIDYVPAYLGMFIPLLLLLFTMLSNKWEKALCLIVLLLTIYDFIGVSAEGGKIGFAAGAFVSLVMLFHKNKKVLIAGGIVVVVGILAVFAVPRIRTAVFTRMGFIQDTPPTPARLTDITTEDTYASFTLDDVTYRVEYEYLDGNILSPLLTDETGEEYFGDYVPTDENQYQYYDFSDEFPEGETMRIAEYESYETGRAIVVNAKGYQLIFSNEIDGTGHYYFLNRAAKFVDMPEAAEMKEADVFQDSIFSGRGTIWNRTLPLLPKHILLGTGSGLFITAYPQNNYVEKLSFSSDYDVKPHCLYMQYFVEEGGVALICLLIFFGIYLVQAFLVVWKSDADRLENRFHLACVAGVVTYLVGGIVTDSMVVYSPLFWCILGIGYAVNYRCKALQEEGAE